MATEKRSKRSTYPFNNQPANPFGQYLRHMKELNGKVDFKKACLDWKTLSKEEKKMYHDRFTEQRIAMRSNCDKLLSHDSVIKPQKKRGPKESVQVLFFATEFILHFFFYKNVFLGSASKFLKNSKIKPQKNSYFSNFL